MSVFVNLDVVLGGLYIGAAAACIAAAAVRNNVSKTVNRLLSEGAADKVSAKTAAELGLGKLGRKVLCGQLYGKLIFCANEYYVRTDRDKPEKKQNPYKNPPLDMDEARFYIPEEKRYQAQVRFPKKGIPVLGVIAAIVILGVVFAAARLVAPKLISMLSSVFS